MNVLVTNTSILNTGDSAILLATRRILRRSLGPRTRFAVHDLQAAPAASRYPGLAPRSILYDDLAAAAPGVWQRRRMAVLLLLAVGLWRTPLGPFVARRLPASLQIGLSDIADADVVVSAGGTYLVPHYRVGPKLLELLVAIGLGRPMVLFTQSLGPFTGRWRWLLRHVLRHARVILVRDTQSRDHLMELGIPARLIIECADAAFALASPLPSDLRQASAPRAALRIAVSVRDWPHFAGDPKQGMSRYLDAVAAVVHRLVTKYGAEVRFVSTCQGVPEYWTDDSRVADAVLARLPAGTQDHVSIDRDFHTPPELIELLQGFDAVVATRMHIAILALCAEVPVLPIAYEFKTEELFARLGFDDLVQPIESLDDESLCDALDRFLAARPRICALLPTAVERARRSALAAGDHVRTALARAR